MPRGEQAAVPALSESDPLLKGVEDNAVFRMLEYCRKTPDGRARARRWSLSGVFFPFDGQIWQDLECSEATPRDFALALLEYRQKYALENRLKVVGVIAVMAIVQFALVGYLRQGAPAMTLCIAFVAAGCLYGMTWRPMQLPLLNAQLSLIRIAAKHSRRLAPMFQPIMLAPLISVVLAFLLCRIVPGWNTSLLELRLAAMSSLAFVFGRLLVGRLAVGFGRVHRPNRIEALERNVAAFLDRRRMESPIEPAPDLSYRKFWKSVMDSIKLALLGIGRGRAATRRKIKLPRPIRREPLMAGIEDNIIYRLLVISETGKHHVRKKRDLACHGFPFSAECWRDLDLTPLTARDYAQASWAFHCYRRGFQFHIRPFIHIAIALLLMGAVGGFYHLYPEYLFFCAIPVCLYLMTMGFSWGNEYFMVPILRAVIDEMRVVRMAKGRQPSVLAESAKFIAPVIFGLVAIGLALKFITGAIYRLGINHGFGWMAIYFMGLGVAVLLFGTYLPYFDFSKNKKKKNELFEQLVAEIEGMTRLRRENDDA
ncbi:MAG: hypothetical protein ABFD69_06485 [Candidatus Sumerlaeia bacterium]